MLDRFAALFERQPRTAEEWLVRLGRPQVSRGRQGAFERWLSADPANLADYQAAKALLRETQDLRTELLGELNLIPPAPCKRRAAAGWTPVTLAGGLVAAVLAVAIAPTLLTRFQDPLAGAATYTTAVGEIRDVTLADGSVVTLDTATTLRAKVDGRVRRLALDNGAAYFAVVHDKAHPFQVALADRQVVVTGTHFATSLRDGRARVELLEGSVEVRQPRVSTEPVRLTPGDQVSYQAGGAVRREARIDPAAAVAWRQRRLVFQDAALSEVLAELGRYTDAKIRLADPALGRQRVTAMLPLDGRGTVVERAARVLPVTLTRTASNEVVASAR
ncbi:FecR domain-containing protein [Caulobacter sp.]|uniref:FecR family protein n=1 Tax=Caulobacter sp. TaxID=78 RepID=UPI001B209504|nr:FecR domain-containing protein [Caulobacter sp.]MBO9546315.1 FecR domain-containing protein [Caulobacter sp.]